MTTYPLNFSSINKPVAPLVLYPRGIAQVEEERKAKGITKEMLERSRNASLDRKF